MLHNVLMITYSWNYHDNYFQKYLLVVYSTLGLIYVKYFSA